VQGFPQKSLRIVDNGGGWGLGAGDLLAGRFRHSEPARSRGEETELIYFFERIQVQILPFGLAQGRLLRFAPPLNDQSGMWKSQVVL
jgi:hypothetical protein